MSRTDFTTFNDIEVDIVAVFLYAINLSILRSLTSSQLFQLSVNFLAISTVVSITFGLAINLCSLANTFSCILVFGF